MKREIPSQLIVALIILFGGGAVLGGEYLLVTWYPRYQQQVAERTLKLLPYHNDRLGIEMQVAAGLYGKVEDFSSGVRIRRPKLWSAEPSLTLTSRPNPDATHEFSRQELAKWQTDGTYQEIPRYRFARTKIQNREAVLIWQYKERSMWVTARVISSERIIEAVCTPGRADEALYMQACEASLTTMKVTGPEPPPPPSPPILELTPAPRSLSRR